jgi:hypothetical protein
MKQTLHHNLIKFIVFFVLALAPYRNFAGPGDTLIVNGFNAFFHANCNTGNSVFQFPSDTLSFYKIMLRYELSCPGLGCDIYDRIAKLKVKRGTGVMDSTLTLAPSYKVNGLSPDSLQYMNDTSYYYSYDTLAMQIDSFPATPLQLVFYGDSLNPQQPTDTVQVWPAYYNQYTFDAGGNAIDSIFVTPDSVIYLSVDSLYSPFEVKETVEIARAITPFGQGVVLWFDVTDYSSLLHDSVELVSTVCGYSNGWLVTTDFYFIEGVPPMHAYKVINLWNGTWPYGNTSNPIDSHLQPITLVVDSQSVYEKVRVITTGHGFGGYPNQNVAEFYDVTHTVQVNGVNMPQRLWRPDCGRNPLFPQGAPGYTSTWFYNRANWCPGSYVKPHDYNATPLVNPGDTLVVDYNMAPYTVTGGPSGFYAPEYYVQSHVFYYDAIAYTHNAAVTEIRRPSGAFEYHRINPICQAYNPEIVIKNYGSDTLHQLEIHYGVDGNYTNNYTWFGGLGMTDTVSVSLPPVSFGAGAHSFDLYIDQPNGNADEFAYDDSMHVSFNATNIYNTNYIVIQLKTDNSPNECSWQVKDDQGTILFQRNNFTGTLSLYTDTIVLPNGCFNVTMYDSFGDGVCCYNGNGYFRLYRGGAGTPLYSSGDYGELYSTNLTLDFQSGLEDVIGDNTVFLFPNPARDKVTLNTGFETGKLTVELTDLTGRRLGPGVVCDVANHATHFDLPNVAPGLYLIRLERKGQVTVKRIVVE